MSCLHSSRTLQAVNQSSKRRVNIPSLGAAADATGESNKRLRRLKEKGRCSRKMKEEELEMDSAEIATGDGSEDGEE